jgi:hypothetical protein
MSTGRASQVGLATPIVSQEAYCCGFPEIEYAQSSSA